MKYLIWDFDGTLASRRGLWGYTLADVAHQEFPDRPCRPEDFAPYLYSGFFWHDPLTPHTHIRTAQQWWSHMAPILCGPLSRVLGIPYADAERLLPQIRAAYTDVRYWRVFPDVEACLRAVSGQGWRSVILTNHVPEFAEIVKALGLSKHFSDMCNSAVTGYEKPHPEAFAAVRRLLPAADGVWMIGDNYDADIAGAEAAGIPGILVRKPRPGARYFHDSLETLPDFLARMPCDAGDRR